MYIIYYRRIKWCSGCIIFIKWSGELGLRKFIFLISCVCCIYYFQINKQKFKSHPSIIIKKLNYRLPERGSCKHIHSKQNRWRFSYIHSVLFFTNFYVCYVSGCYLHAQYKPSLQVTTRSLFEPPFILPISTKRKNSLWKIALILPPV